VRSRCLLERSIGITKILLVNEWSLVRTGLSAILEDEHDFEVIAQSSNYRDALKIARSIKPDMVLIDQPLAAAYIAGASEGIRLDHSKPKIVALTGWSDGDSPPDTIATDADACFELRDLRPQQLLELLRTLGKCTTEAPPLGFVPDDMTSAPQMP